jgi:hypothetical protein
LNCSRVPLLPRLCHVHGRKRRPTPRSPGQTLTAVSNLIYDHRISTCFLYGCVGTCWWEFGDPGHENAMFSRCVFCFFILDRCFAKIICILGASDVIEESPAIFGMPPWAACNMCRSHLCKSRTLGRTRNVHEGNPVFQYEPGPKGRLCYQVGGSHVHAK